MTWNRVVALALRKNGDVAYLVHDRHEAHPFAADEVVNFVRIVDHMEDRPEVMFVSDLPGHTRA